MAKMIKCQDLEREFFKNISESNSRSSTPVPQSETEDERAARANFQWFLSSLSVPLYRETHPFKSLPINNQVTDGQSEDGFGKGLSIVAMLTRLKVENDRKQAFATVYKGPISNRGKVRLN